MLTPEQAVDLLEDPFELSAWMRQEGYCTAREAIQVLRRVAEPLLTGGAPLPESKILRQARAAHADRGPGGGSRDDLEALCDFVERAARLPMRVKEVFGYCIVQGLSRRECAARLGIAPATVKVHLRRLRQLMKEHGGLSGQNYPWG